jgi:dolichol-phosphate mannosyltransferase
MKVACMIAVYNELENCQLLLPELQSVLDQLAVDYHVIFVIAGDDGTREYLDNYPSDRVWYIYEWDVPKWLWHAYNVGYREALVYKPDVVVSLDGDGNHDPALLVRMFAAIQDGYDIVVGSRYIAGGGYTSDVDLPLYKVVLSRWMNVILSWVLWLSVVDKSSGYRCVRASYVAKIIDEWHPLWFSHQVYLLWLWSFMGARILEIPQQHRPRHHGESKFPILSTFRWYLVLCWVIWRRKSF